MIRIWIYTKLEKYYKFCLHKWMDIYCESRSDQALCWTKHYSDRLRKTHMKNEAYKYYISLRRL